MAGEYDLIGRKADSSATYKGRVTLRNEGGVLQVTRFHFDGNEYDATYRWQSDPDNYPRFIGYLYLSATKSPGLEALFPIHK